MEKPNGSNNQTGSAGMKAYDLEIALQLDARCQSWPTLYTWDRRSLLSLVKSALLFMVSLESLLSHFNSDDKSRTFGYVSPVTLARLEASRGQEPHACPFLSAR